MLDVFNYEGKQINLYPQIWIDWLTPHEIQFIKDNNNELEQNLNSMFNNELVEEGNEIKLINSKKELDIDVEEEIEDPFGESIEEEIEDPFGESIEDLFSESVKKECNEEEEFLSEIEKLIEESDKVKDNFKDLAKQDIFSLKAIPVFVGEEKIADLPLNIGTLKLLNMFIKREWVLKISENEEIVMDDEFLIRNSLKLC